MCGRYALHNNPEVIKLAFELGVLPEIAPRYNIAPYTPVLIVRKDPEKGRIADLVRWGLIPSWAKDPAIGNKLANARGETLLPLRGRETGRAVGAVKRALSTLWDARASRGRVAEWPVTDPDLPVQVLTQDNATAKSHTRCVSGRIGAGAGRFDRTRPAAEAPSSKPASPGPALGYIADGRAIARQARRESHNYKRRAANLGQGRSQHE